MIQAIVWALVPTSGAGMSRVRPDDAFELGREPAGQRLELPRAHRAAGRRSRRPWRRRTARRRGRTSRSSTSPARGRRRGRSPGGSAARPWRARARRCAGRGSPVKTSTRAVVPLDREVDGELALRNAEDGTETGSSPRWSAAASNWARARGERARRRRTAAAGARGRAVVRSQACSRVERVTVSRRGASRSGRRPPRVRANPMDTHERGVNTRCRRAVHALFMRVPGVQAGRP